ncbi:MULTISPECIES: LysR substrate-binding domain-containing protein [Actinopolyspora]|uniref:DNA-binding transcriptional regulator, LysR family n=1 Tax=Actinopolyspora saharensis TaxID=995062 RepID=A0A1H1DYM4_9ACTN|nr:MULTISPECIES: LysR substrate-binding domain-containing protein [Actinopolyspora]NHD18699.1 LysR family transcriptional regulator [Actinopolyspora sp. BKK2]NHE77979.1 LysR family transcriptional regulator [Actinopolyspora sp. BKK1]SDQ81584.1 DNA-binding transcriptional regulator, LysR family [Actinopolyspora saharensis]
MFTFTQLSSFIAVADELHFGRAAERLQLTQPPLSRHIQQLERELDTRLIDRGSRTVRLTPAGEKFLRDARNLVYEAENAIHSARRVSTGVSGSIRIGFTATSAYEVLGGLVETAQEHLPHVDIQLRELVTRDQLKLLAEGSLDLGLIRPPVSDPALSSKRLLAERLLVALPMRHPLAVRTSEPLALTELAERDLVMYSPTEARYFHELLVGMFREAGVAPRYRQYVSQIHTMLALVEVELGAALVPAAATRLGMSGVVFREVRLPVPEPVELHAAWRTSNDNPALEALLTHLGG